MASLTILHFTAQDLKDMYQVTYFKADTKTVFFLTSNTLNLLANMVRIHLQDRPGYFEKKYNLLLQV